MNLYTSANVVPPLSITFEDMLKALNEIKVSVCPIAIFMIKQGFDPKRGCYLVLPKAMKKVFDEYGGAKPPYLQFSEAIENPILIGIPDFVQIRNSLTREEFEQLYPKNL